MLKRLFILLSFAFLGYSDEYLFLFMDDMEEGAINIQTLHKLTNRGGDFGISNNIIGRFGKLFAFDIPFSLWTTTFDHEYFGHGIRARELGLSADYYIPPPWPYRYERAYCFVKEYPNDIEKRLYMATSGIEANQLLANRLQREFYKDKNIHYYELLLFFCNKLNINFYIIRTPDPNFSEDTFKKEGGDIANYLVMMDTKKNKRDYKENYIRLKKESVWNLADPCLWISGYFLGRYLVFGEKDFKMPILKGTSIGTRFNLTPIGEEGYLDIYQKNRYFYLRKGEGFYGIGVGIDDFLLFKEVLGGCKIDWWKQSNKEGYHLNANLTKDITNWLDFIIDAGLKSEGYLMGKGFNGDKYGAMGINFTF